MTSELEEVLRLLGEVRRTKTQLGDIESELLSALGGRRQKPVYERAVEWLLATLVEKPIKRIVDNILDRVDQKRLRRNRKFPARN